MRRLREHGEVPCRRSERALLDSAVQCHGGDGVVLEYGLTEVWWLARLLKIAPVSREVVLNYVPSTASAAPSPRHNEDRYGPAGRRGRGDRWHLAATVLATSELLWSEVELDADGVSNTC